MGYSLDQDAQTSLRTFAALGGTVVLLAEHDNAYGSSDALNDLLAGTGLSVRTDHIGAVSGPFDITASALPAIIEAWAVGLAAPVELPSRVGVTADTVYALVEKAQGLDLARGGGRQTMTVGPAREYSTASTLASGAGILRSDVAAVCGSAGWISVIRTCTDLKGFIADESVDLGGFLDYLASQRGEGKPLSNNNAYCLLKTIAEYARSRVTSANVELAYACGTRLVARNRNSVGLPVTYEVVGTSETGSLRLPPRTAGQEYSETAFATKAGGKTRILYGGIPVTEQAYESRACP